MSTILDITGKRFGLLTAIRIDHMSDQGAIWLCSCWCGGSALRSAASLNASIKRRSAPQCANCLRELNSGKTIDYRNSLKERLLSRWEEDGVLWSDFELERLHRDIVRDLYVQEIYVSEEEPEPPKIPIRLNDNEGHAFSNKISILADGLDGVNHALNADRLKQESQSSKNLRGLEKLETELELVAFRERSRSVILEKIAKEAYEAAS